MTDSGSGQKKTFIIVVRGPSAAIFRERESMYINDFGSSIGPVNITFTTRWLHRGQDAILPGHLWVEISGEGNSLEEVLVPFANAALSVLPLLSVCTNAAVGEPEIELGFENTKDANEREYFQAYMSFEPEEVHVYRFINIKATIAVIRALSIQPDSERLLRGANQYRVALDSWRLGREALALAHLWMALEAITKAKIRAEIESRGFSNEEDLARFLQVEKRELEATIRKNLILDGDKECYSKAKEASDGLEHGYLCYSDIISNAREVRHRMAFYVRKAILDIIGLDETTYGSLAVTLSNQPLGYWPMVKYLRGILVGGSSEGLAAAGNPYPFMRMKPQMKSTSVEADGSFSINMEENLTAELGEGVSIRLGSFELWQPG